MTYDKDYSIDVMDRFDAFIRFSKEHPSPPYSLVPGRNELDSTILTVNQDSVLNFLDVALNQTYLLLDDESFYVCDLSKNTSTEYNTLVFQIDGTVLKSKENTHRIMTRYMKYIGVNYKVTRQLGKSVGIISQCPFVCGSHFSQPLPLLSTWLMTQSYLQGRWMVKDMLKEGDPLLDDLPPEEFSDDNESDYEE